MIENFDLANPLRAYPCFDYKERLFQGPSKPTDFQSNSDPQL